ncbi:MAG: OmpA family protein [Pseudomonadota bacterium]
MDLPQELDAGAPPGAVQTAYADRDLDTYALPIGDFSASDIAVLPLTGRVVWSAFRLTGQETVAAVLAGYRKRLEGLGFNPLFDCETRTCGGFDFRFEAELLPAPGMLLDTADFAQLSMERGHDRTFASILVSRVLDAVYVQTVLVAEAAEVPDLQPAPGVETAPETVILPQDEKALYDRLIAEGHVPIAGLSFETGGAVLSPESNEALDLLGRLLNRNDIEVVIVGHSDNEGGLEPNKVLSRQRAQAVREALIARGVAEAQMEADGVAFLAPVSSNATEEGRAANRRVELVLK